MIATYEVEGFTFESVGGVRRTAGRGKTGFVDVTLSAPVDEVLVGAISGTGDVEEGALVATEFTAEGSLPTESIAEDPHPAPNPTHRTPHANK